MRDPKACKQSTVEVDEVFIESNSVIDEIVTKQLRATLGKQLQMERRFTYGSFYLRMGAVGTKMIRIYYMLYIETREAEKEELELIEPPILTKFCQLKYKNTVYSVRSRVHDLFRFGIRTVF